MYDMVICNLGGNGEGINYDIYVLILSPLNSRCDLYYIRETQGGFPSGKAINLTGKMNVVSYYKENILPL